MNYLSNSQKGNSLVETSILLTLIFPCIIAGLSLAGAAGARVLAQKCVYEGLICIIEAKKASECKKIVKAQLKLIIPFGYLSRLVLEQNAYSIKGELHWQWNKHWSMKIHDLLPLELKP